MLQKDGYAAKFSGSRFDAMYVRSGGLAKHVSVPVSVAGGPPTIPKPDAGAPLGDVGRAY
jgi:methyl coenzyme M reductase subunit C-like uncharacterized protein (methanogenesis marker protein 7)